MLIYTSAPFWRAAIALRKFIQLGLSPPRIYILLIHISLLHHDVPCALTDVLGPRVSTSNPQAGPSSGKDPESVRYEIRALFLGNTSRGGLFIKGEIINLPLSFTKFDF